MVLADGPSISNLLSMTVISHGLFVVAMSGALTSACACRRVSQFAGPDAESTSRSSRGRCRQATPAPADTGRDAAEDQRRAAPLKFSGRKSVCGGDVQRRVEARRSEEHTSELQSVRHLVCRLLLE